MSELTRRWCEKKTLTRITLLSIDKRISLLNWLKGLVNEVKIHVGKNTSAVNISQAEELSIWNVHINFAKKTLVNRHEIYLTIYLNM